MIMEFLRGTGVPAPSDERIARLESAFRIRFPSSYRSFLRTGNGAVPVRCLLTDRQNTRVVERFLSISDDRSRSPGLRGEAPPYFA